MFKEQRRIYRKGDKERTRGDKMLEPPGTIPPHTKAQITAGRRNKKEGGRKEREKRKKKEKKED